MENRVSLHYAALPAQPWDTWLAAWLPALPAAKRAQVANLRDPADRIASVLGIALLRAACAARGIAFDGGALEYPARGKPRLRGAPDFSIAHAGGLVGCALGTDARVGFDLERRDAVHAVQLRLVLGPAESHALANGALDAADAWVMKEAVLKAAGQGAREAPHVALPVAGEGGCAAYAGAEYRLARVVLAPTHAAWLATPAAQAPLVDVHEHVAERVLATGAGLARCGAPALPPRA